MLRTALPGKSMKDVVAMLGSPPNVFTIDEREIWNYGSVAYDSITHKNAKTLELVFFNRRVQSVNFSF